MGQMQPRQLGMIAGEEFRRAGVNAARALGGVFESFGRLRDYRSMAEAKLKLRGIQDEMEVDFKERLQAAPGSARSFFNADGTRSQEKMDAFTQRWGDRLGEVSPGEFYDLTKRSEWEMERKEFVENSVKRLSGQAQLHEIDNIRRVGDATLKECAQNDDAGGFALEVQRQVDAGVLTEQEGRLKMLAFGKGRLRRGGGVSIGGQEYSGLDAAYAAQAAHEGYKVGEDAAQQAAPAGDFTLGGVPEEVSLKGAVGTETEVATPVVQEDYTLDAERMRDAIAPRGDDWLKMGDFSEVLKACNQQERMELQGLWDESYAVKAQELPDGSVRYDAGVGAPDAVELVAASGNVEGVPSKDATRALVANVLFGELAESPGLSDERLVKVFEDSGVFRILGDGDEERGKNVVTGMAQELKARGSGSRERLTVDQIEVMIDAQVNDPMFGAGEEWREMEALNPGLKDDEAYKKPKDDAGRKKWFALFEVYKKYRDRFNPYHSDGDADRDEFAGVAQRFYRWYMGDDGVHKDAKAASVKAAKDWYKQEALQDLQDAGLVGNDGKADYAAELEVFRKTLKKRSPLAPAVERMMSDNEERAIRAHNDNVARARGAAPYYEQLLKMKHAEVENSEKAQNAKKREEDRQRRADAKAEEDKAKLEEKREEMRRRVELQSPKVGRWGWNSQPVTGEKIPQCQVPKAEYERLVRLGYDGTQRVYMKVGTKEVLVDMGAPAPGDVVLMNAPACEYMQPPKPKGKKGAQAPKVLHGNTDYYFIFKR